jgi:hypothetical protein
MAVIGLGPCTRLTTKLQEHYGRAEFKAMCDKAWASTGQEFVITLEMAREANALPEFSELTGSVY